ncbi:carbohydrate ABC transporter permease [Virgibacillus siamensis]|uniref:carbohydrate ABC transporter permease n=1 Tax=Virgibacillus siamensis TaxID=480071 RepID=UPI000986A456|nr:carbohydrate ABC transporter permease [Virgibacillus siamensis]
MKFNVLIRYLILGFASIIFIFPLYWMITGAFKNEESLYSMPPDWFPTELYMGNFIAIFEHYPIMLWLWNSLFIGIISVILIILLSATAGYALAKIRFPGDNLIFVLVIATMMLPHETILVTLYELTGEIGLLDSSWGVILPTVAFPFGVFLVRQFARSIPEDLLNAARIDGASELRIFFSIVVPMLLPALGALAIFAFMYTWNNYAWQLVVLSSHSKLTFPLGLTLMANQDPSGATLNYAFLMAGASIAAVPLIIFFLLLQRSFIKGVALGSVKG